MATDAVASPWRRYLRISLRGLIVLVLVLGSALGWIVHRAKVQRDAVVSDAGLEQLKNNSSLHTLILSGTKVTDAGVLRLQQALPKLRIVR